MDKFNSKKNIKQLINLFTCNNIQVRPVWYPNHLQKPYYKFERYNIRQALNLVDITLCLPSSVALKKPQIKKIVTLLKK